MCICVEIYTFFFSLEDYCHCYGPVSRGLWYGTWVWVLYINGVNFIENGNTVLFEHIFLWSEILYIFIHYRVSLHIVLQCKVMRKCETKVNFES